jgi:hypothetical protein
MINEALYALGIDGGWKIKLRLLMMLLEFLILTVMRF